MCRAAMLHVDPSMLQPVPFAWDEASKLKQELLQAADELEGQIGARRADGREALEEWRGAYAREFEHEHMATTTGDAQRIAAALRDCAELLHGLANLARKEEERRQALREWQTAHDAWEREQASHDGILGAVKDIGDFFTGDDEPKPPDLEPITPKPINVHAPSVGHRG
jgi:transposase